LSVSTGGFIGITALLKQAGLAPSSAEANRNIEQGGVKIDGAKISDRALNVGPGVYVVQVGKRKFARVTIS
jgi:tyrosyl-tRNA synthetase